jgi:nitrogen regulatory protein PII
MKLIVATIRPEKLESVQSALHEPGVTLVAVSQALDLREPCPRERYRGAEIRVPRVRLRVEVVVVNEALLGWAVRSIARAAATGGGGRIGDGEILVTSLDECVSVADAARGEALDDESDLAEVLPPLYLGRMRP